MGSWKPPETDEVITASWTPPAGDEIISASVVKEEPEKPFLGGLAKAASSIVSSKPTNRSGGFLQRLGESTKELVMPSMDGLKRLFSPGAGQFGPSRFLEEEGKKVGQAVRSSAQNIADKMATSVPGAAAGAALGTAADVTSDMLTPSSFQQSLGSEAPGLLGPAIKGMAVEPARRALGITKMHMSNSKSGFEAIRKQAVANKTAADMLEKNAIAKLGSTSQTTENAFKILHEGTRGMDDVIGQLDSAGAKIDQNKLAVKLIDELNPKLPEEQAVLEKMLSDLQSFPNGIPIAEAKRKLKDYWGTKGFEQLQVGSAAASLYRKAAQTLEREMSDVIKTAGGPELSELYAMSNKSYGTAVNALKGLGNKLAAEMGNNAISLPSTIWAASRLAAGDLMGAASAAGLSEVAKRRGAGIAANVLFRGGRGIESAPPQRGFTALLQSSKARLKQKEEGKKTKL